MPCGLPQADPVGKLGGGGAGPCFNFHSGRGSPPLDPPPSPLRCKSAEHLGFGDFFQ